MNKTIVTAFVFFWSAWTIAFANPSIEIVGPTDVSGRLDCQNNYSLVDGVCVSAHSLSRFSTEQIAEAIDAHKASLLAAKDAGNPQPPMISGIPAYSTRIAEKEGNIILLMNGAKARVPYNDIWHVSAQKGCILFKEGDEWKLWIKRQDDMKKQLFCVELVEKPGPEPNYISSMSEFLQLSEKHH